MELSYEQKLILESQEPKIVVSASAGSGKALKNTSTLFLEDGTTTTIGEVKVGQRIFGEDGKPHTVTGVFPQGVKDVYRVFLTDGTYVDCSNDHLWTFQTKYQRDDRKRNEKWTTATLQEIMDVHKVKIPARNGVNGKVQASEMRNIYLPMTKPVEFAEKEVPLDAYTMGALLGDGFLNGRSSESSFSNINPKIIKKVELGLEKINMKLVLRGGCDYGIVKGEDHSTYINTLNLILESLGLDFSRSDSKFIPDLYKYNSIEIRKNVLIGLCDTDGSVAKGNSIEYSSVSKQLAEDVQFIAESLGFTARMTERTTSYTYAGERKNGRNAFRVIIKLSKDADFRLCSEKQEKFSPKQRVFAKRAIDRIEKMGEAEMTCISVDNPTSLFLTDHFIVTHNTRTLIEVIRKELKRPDCDPKRIVLITFTNNSANEMKSRLGKDYREEMYIGTIHGYANLLLTESGFSTAAIRQEENFDQLFNEAMYNPKCIRPVDFLALDEAQDSSALHYEFILDMVQPERWIIFGDERQSIYGFNNASPESFRSLARQEDVMTYYLNENYRCGKRIVELGNRLAVNAVKRPLPPASPARDDLGKVIELKSSSDIITQISKNNDFRGTAVLCRTNRKVGEIIHQLTRKGIPTITYKQGDNTIEELEAKNRMDAVKVLTIHSAKGLEFDNVFLIELEDKSRESWRLMYVAATRAKNNLYFWVDGRRPAYEIAKILRGAAKRSK